MFARPHGPSMLPVGNAKNLLCAANFVDDRLSGQEEGAASGMGRTTRGKVQLRASRAVSDGGRIQTSRGFRAPQLQHAWLQVYVLRHVRHYVRDGQPLPLLLHEPRGRSRSGTPTHERATCRHCGTVPHRPVRCLSREVLQPTVNTVIWLMRPYVG